MARDDHIHGVGAEPVFRPDHDSPTRPDEEPAIQGRSLAIDEEARAQQSVWDEPAIRRAGLAAPTNAQTYAGWYRRKLAETPLGRVCAVTVLMMLAGGPVAVFTAFWNYRPALVTAGSAMVVIVTPVLEEMAKIAAMLIILERWPYYIRSTAQIFAVLVVGAAAFAAAENLLYLHVYLPRPSPALVTWRWTICTALHIGSTTVAGVGVYRMWTESRRDFSKPDTRHAYPYIVAAVLLHGAYNLAAVAASAFLEPL